MNTIYSFMIVFLMFSGPFLHCDISFANYKLANTNYIEENSSSEFLLPPETSLENTRIINLICTKLQVQLWQAAIEWQKPLCFLSYASHSSQLQ